MKFCYLCGVASSDELFDGEFVGEGLDVNLFVACDGLVHIKADGFDAVHPEVSVDEDLSW